MTLKIVGAGLGRTGTNSLKHALELLGFDRCHHMEEVLGSPAQIAHWGAAARGEPVDWNAIFAGYAAAVDWPSAFFWRELAAFYPKAKVLLSVRPEKAWLASIQGTIFALLRKLDEAPPGAFRDAMAMAHRLIVERTFGGDIDDPDHVVSVYRAHAEAVRRGIASDRLLVYDVAEGWEPLCRFLGVPVPDGPFPHTNTSRDFMKLVEGAAGRRA